MAEVMFEDDAKRVPVVAEPETLPYARYVDGAQVGTLSYRVVEQQRVLGHTEVDKTCRGRGLSQIADVIDPSHPGIWVLGFSEGPAA
ncbi:hypothetical protein ACIF85_46765 [Streptomyces sp. NPDC086033]|uniref:hypothetical protein n=1 Tax=Streptomyces sp. NPDC086033 TaxID=3365747 RepID=UPI0037D6857B